MKPLQFNIGSDRTKKIEGSTRVVLLVLVCFLLGAAVSAFWFSQRATTGARRGEERPRLSEATKSVLQHLGSPVELRLYSVLDLATVSAEVQAYSKHVDELAAVYADESGGKVKLTRIESGPGFSPGAADADGIKAFNLDKGDACYFGISVAQDGRKETLPYLAIEWQAALESDLTRAIARVAQSAAVASSTPARVDPTVVAAVKNTFTNLDAVTMEEGTRMLREAALKEFAAAAQRIQAEIKEAQQQFVQSQNASPAEREAAMKKLQDLQLEQTEKLKQIAANSKAQMEALQQLKAAGK